MTKLIVALDTNNVEAAIELALNLNNVEWFKVGPVLYVQDGPNLIKRLKLMHKKVMLDLKFHDIPNTVEKACRSAVNLGVDMLTTHLSGGYDMVQAAVTGCAGKAKVLGISILTSLSESSLTDIGFNTDYYPAVPVLVSQLVSLGLGAGVDGIVCSAMETAKLKAEYSDEEFLTVNPGIRLPDSNQHDQKRIATPKVAACAGADFIVMGRSIYGADDPKSVVDTVLSNIKEAE